MLSFIDALYVSALSSSTQQYINQMSLCNYLIFFGRSLYVSAWSSSTQQYINQVTMQLLDFLHMFLVRFGSVIYTTIYKSNVTVITCFSSYMLCTFRHRSSSTQQYINQMSLCNYVIFFIHALYVSAQSSTQQYMNQMSL